MMAVCSIEAKLLEVLDLIFFGSGLVDELVWSEIFFRFFSFCAMG